MADQTDLENSTAADLRERAKDEGVTGTSKMRKDELVDALASGTTKRTSDAEADADLEDDEEDDDAEMEDDEDDSDDAVDAKAGERGTRTPSPIGVTKALKGIDFPASKDDLVAHARENGADEDVLAMLEAMPDQSYESVKDVTKGYKSAE